MPPQPMPPAARPTPSGRFVLSDDMRRAVDEVATLAADTYCARCRYDNPALTEAELKALWEKRKKEEYAAVMPNLEEVLANVNRMAASAPPGRYPVLSFGSQTIAIESQEDMNRATRSIIQVSMGRDLEVEKRFYDNHRSLQEQIRTRAAAIRAGTATHLTDLELARWHDANLALTEAGEQQGRPRSELIVQQHRRELDMYALRRRPAPGEVATNNVDDARGIALATQRLAEAEQRLAEERRAAEAARPRPPVMPPAVPPMIPPAADYPPAIPPAADDDRRMPPATPPGNAPSGTVMETARQEALAILTGQSTFQSEFGNAPRAAAGGNRGLLAELVTVRR